MGLLQTRLSTIDRSEAIRLAPAAGLMIVWLALMPSGGGFDAGSWLPAGLALLGLLAVAAFGAGTLLPAARAPRIALGAFAAFTLLNFLSIAWSAAPADALEASDLLLTTLASGWI